MNKVRRSRNSRKNRSNKIKIIIALIANIIFVAMTDYFVINHYRNKWIEKGFNVGVIIGYYGNSDNHNKSDTNSSELEL